MSYFTVSELCSSSTAARLKLDNTPPPAIKKNLEETIKFLDLIRVEWGKYCEKHGLANPSIKVSSGYRSPAVNKAVGGAPTSAHQFGYAADLQPANGKQTEFEKFFVTVFSKLGHKYDQIIIEKSKTSRWVHVGYKKADGTQRMMCFNLKVS